MPALGLFFVLSSATIGFSYSETTYKSKVPNFLVSYFQKLEHSQPLPSTLAVVTPKTLSIMREKLSHILSDLSQDELLRKGEKIHYLEKNLHAEIAKIYPSTNFVFELRGFPQFIFKMSLTDNDQLSLIKRVENSRKGQEIIRKHQLRYVLIPWTQIIEIKTKQGKIFQGVVEEKVDLMKYDSKKELELYLDHIYSDLNVPKQLLLDSFEMFQASFAQMQAYEYFAYFTEKSPALRKRFLEFFTELAIFISNLDVDLEIKADNFPLEKNGRGILVADFDIQGPGEKSVEPLAGLGRLLYEPRFDILPLLYKAATIPFKEINNNLREKSKKRFEALRRILESKPSEFL